MAMPLPRCLRPRPGTPNAPGPWLRPVPLDDGERPDFFRITLTGDEISHAYDGRLSRRRRPTPAEGGSDEVVLHPDGCEIANPPWWWRVGLPRSKLDTLGIAAFRGEVAFSPLIR
jgi:hypothetical protein